MVVSIIRDSLSESLRRISEMPSQTPDFAQRVDRLCIVFQLP
jgi:hypothetical protein